jgi:outer membrane protein assembly factor BamB
MALLRLDGTAVWKTPWDEKDPCHPYHGSDVRPAPGDADADGHVDLFVPGVKCGDKRELQCRDAASGAVKWRLPLSEHPSEPAVADIDSDGRDECLFTVATKLYCVGATPDGRAGQVKWTLPLPNYATGPAVADVLGDGHAQIVVGCQDGYVYGIGAAK